MSTPTGIFTVTHNRMPGVLTMHSDLMGATGFGHYFQQCRMRKAPTQLEARNRRLAGGIYRDYSLAGADHTLLQGHIDHVEAVGPLSMHQSQVMLIDISYFKFVLYVL